MGYVDGFVMAVPKTNKEAFRDHALKIDSLFTKHGATHVIEAWGDDVPKGETTDFYKAVKAKDNEAIVFAWVFWPDKATREAGNAKVMTDMEAMGEEAMKMPFDGKRMIFGSFDVLVEITP